MAKINFKLKAMRSVTVRALNGKLYNLKSGVNSFELEYNDYAALLKALGMKPKPEKKDAKQAKVSESKELKDNESIVAEEPVSDTSTARPDETSSDEHTDESEVSTDEQEDRQEDASDESEVSEDEQEAKEDSKEVDYDSMSYTKLKAEYKRITCKQCKLKKDELIKFLQEHRDA